MILQDLVEELGGSLVQGDPEWMVDGVNSCEKASAFDVAFADSDATVAAGLGSNAGVVVLKPGAAKEYPRGKCIVESDDPKLWFAKAAKVLKKRSLSVGIAHSAVVAPDAKVDQAVVVGPCAVIGSHVKIGDGTHIGAGAVIGENVTIGLHCQIYPRVVIYPGHNSWRSRGGTRRRGAGSGWVWLCARSGKRRVYAVSATGHACDRGRR